jgi:spoIIIJ-associated protein
MNEEESILFATKFVEDLLSFYGLNVAVSSTRDEDVIKLSIPSTSMNSLIIGRESQNLRSLQHITMMALISKEAKLHRVNIDVADYKRHREERIAEKAEGWINKVRTTGESMTLELSPADRRIVHQIAADYSDIDAHSEGIGRERHLIISKI